MIVEGSNENDVPLTSELTYRLNQQRILADFGIEALRSRDEQSVLQRATELCAQGMRTHLSKVLEYKPGPDRMLLRAGVGWKPGIVGVLEIGADMESPAGFALKTGEAVISNHLQDETRFRTPAFMAAHGVKRAINVLIEVSGQRYGVLEVDSPGEGAFEAADLAFMQGFASLVGVAIERQRAEERLNAALAHQELLTREASHRVKNSLTMVSAMLNLQMNEDEDPRIRRMLGDAQARITTIAHTHDQLWRGDKVGVVNLAELVTGLCRTFDEQAPVHQIRCNADTVILSADAAIPIGLVVSELVTNAIKYAYGERGGDISVGIVAADGMLTLTVADNGCGVPAGFSIERESRESLGMRMISSLVRQLRATIAFEDGTPGTVVRILIPDPR